MYLNGGLESMAQLQIPFTEGAPLPDGCLSAQASFS